MGTTPLGWGVRGGNSEDQERTDSMTGSEFFPDDASFSLALFGLGGAAGA